MNDLINRSRLSLLNKVNIISRIAELRGNTNLQRLNVTYLKLYSLVIAILLSTSCSNKLSEDNVNCDGSALGNLGKTFNSKNDELFPMINQDISPNSLFFSQITSSKKGKTTTQAQALFTLDIDGERQKEDITSLLADEFSFFSTPIIREDNGQYEAIFAGVRKKGKSDRNIYSCCFDILKNEICNIEEIKELNTPNFEDSPTLSVDGNSMIFASDREGGVGGLDLYISTKNFGKWSKPVNLGDKFNTDKDDSYPFIDDNYNLYFSSKTFAKDREINIVGSRAPSQEVVEVDSSSLNYDIYVAKNLDLTLGGTLSQFHWEKPKRLPEPINTPFEEITPYVNDNQIYFASDRKNGYGGLDLYSFQLCNPSIVFGNVSSKNDLLWVEGEVVVKNAISGELVQSVPVDEDGNYTLTSVLPGEYILEYYNTCIEDLKLNKNIEIECSEGNILKLKVDFIINRDEIQFDLNQYNIPFFVSGYYKPNTSNNLKELKLLFNYNIMGNADSTLFIENPSNKYDLYAVKVDEAFHKIIEMLSSQLQLISSSCYKKESSKIRIKILGYTDTRSFSGFSKYNGETIDDKNIGFYLGAGQTLNNKLLANLRAYFTYREVLDMLKIRFTDDVLEDNIIWEVGAGEQVGVSSSIKNNDTNSIKNDLMRRVGIKISTK